MSDSVMMGIWKAVTAGVTLGAGWIIIEIILHIEKKALTRSKVDEALHLFVIRATKVVLWIILIIAALSMIGVSTASLVAVVGAGGAAIALALRDSLSNVAGGIILLINKPFIKGDTIELNGTVGVVDSIDLLTTRLHTFDNKAVSIPNGTMTTGILYNYTKEDKRRVDCVFSVSYSADFEHARELMRNVALSCEEIFKEPEPVMEVASLGENSVMMTCWVWCATCDYYNVQYYLQENVKIAFAEAGISIPYQQIDIHVVK
jgi:Small-conductance mechanosensitive channel